MRARGMMRRRLNAAHSQHTKGPTGSFAKPTPSKMPDHGRREKEIGDANV
jgi:hypothetical protein